MMLFINTIQLSDGALAVPAATHNNWQLIIKLVEIFIDYLFHFMFMHYDLRIAAQLDHNQVYIATRL